MKRVSASYLFVLLFLMVNLRGMLGYIFRFGEPATSPTYSPVPMKEFLLLKAMIAIPMAVLVLCKIKKISIRYSVVYLCILLFSLVCFLQAESFHIRGAARSIVLYGFFFLCLYSNGSWIRISHINKAIEFMAVFGLLFLFYQIYQYHYIGILPAHSHANQSIRYGSFYNDSLVLGILLPMFAGYYFNKYPRNIPSLFIAAVVCFVAILTGSMTAMAVVFLCVAWNFRRRYILLLPFLCSILFSSFFFIEKIKNLWAFKSGSIAAHLDGLDYFRDLEALTFIGFCPLDKLVETGYLLFLYNFGVPILLAVLALNFVTLKACRVILSGSIADRETRAFAGATEGLSISVLFANLNLPLIVYPPIYLFVAIFSAIVIKKAVLKCGKKVLVKHAT